MIAIWLAAGETQSVDGYFGIGVAPARGSSHTPVSPAPASHRVGVVERSGMWGPKLEPQPYAALPEDPQGFVVVRSDRCR